MHLLFDIEGTTTPISFVHDVLFPYARQALPVFLDAHGRNAEVIEALRLLAADLRAEEDDAPQLQGDDGDTVGAIVDAVHYLMDRDRKAAGLKRLQGLIWRQGYADGTLRGELYPDVAPAFRRFHERGWSLGIYSSGSVEAQKLIMGCSTAGDLTPLLSSFHDTAVGGKKEAQSYRNIARELGVAVEAIRFFTDSLDEARAAREAGCFVVLSIRPGNAELPADHGFPVAHSLDELETHLLR